LQSEYSPYSPIPPTGFPQSNNISYMRLSSITWSRWDLIKNKSPLTLMVARGVHYLGLWSIFSCACMFWACICILSFGPMFHICHGQGGDTVF
jgi:hypothetical protein